MNILLLGGSNAGLHFGWAAQFQALLPQHSITNRFLGAVGSLYGLMRLIEMEREKVSMPDLLIFEYTLNDMILLEAGYVPMSLLEDAVTQVVEICGRNNIRLLFLCLETRPSGQGRINPYATRVKSLYARIAQARSVRQCVMLEAIFGAVQEEQFLDEHHLTEEASRRVAEYIALTLDAIPVPAASGSTINPFRFIHARDAKFEGPCRLIEIQSTVFCGTFLEIARSGISRWPGEGLLVGLMLRSTESAGVFRIRADGRAFRKNAQSKMREIVPKIILLHCSTRRPRIRSDLEIAMPAREVELMRLPTDKTLLETPCAKPFDEQLLEINGVMVWRRNSLRSRWLSGIKRSLGKLSVRAARAEAVG